AAILAFCLDDAGFGQRVPTAGERFEVLSRELHLRSIRSGPITTWTYCRLPSIWAVLVYASLAGGLSTLSVRFRADRTPYLLAAFALLCGLALTLLLQAVQAKLV